MSEWPLWEVFVRPRRGLSHTHVGSLHAPDAELVQRDVRQRHVLLQLGRPGAPLGQALRRDERVVAETEYVVEPHRCFAPSGTS